MKSLIKLILGTIWATSISNANCVQAQTILIAQTTTVEALKDIEPNDWAYEALRSLSDRFLMQSLMGESQGAF